ncbi:hypothetical protein ACFP1Z_32795 [Streptomyces gamaensis]|uniref:Uncharacterized protein n=1 Tax=Streptomyces gamaensis TaxID=1763542 RepID=A0ABW0Z7X7_9ACTN
MGAQPIEPYGPTDQLRSGAEIRRALPPPMRSQFDQALAGAVLAERAHILALWSGIVIEAAHPSGDDQVRCFQDGTLEAHPLEWCQQQEGSTW